MLTLSNPEVDRNSRATRERKHSRTASAGNMLKIHSLLNPSTSDRLDTEPVNPPPTPTYTSQGSTLASTPQPAAPDISSPSKRQKHIKDAAVFARSDVKGSVNYPPYECTEDAICLSSADQNELARQHKRFKVSPANDTDTLIGDSSKYIPYASDKKDFFSKTKREGFEVFHYTFNVPDDFEDKKYDVLWDYSNGLVRITPFFKALKWAKTAPNKALTSNSGLKDLAHSITGGALLAQGYWIPYSCARAICLTFCHKIRWALTPIFGQSFIRECVRPDQPGYKTFRIDAEIVRCAQLEADGWSTGTSSGALPVGSRDGEGKEIPRSAPAPEGVTMSKTLPPRAARPAFKFGSPFESDADTSEAGQYTLTTPSLVDSPDVSPKTSKIAWTSINHRHPTHRTSPSSTKDTPASSLSRSLLTQPHHASAYSWRPADVETENKSQKKKMTIGAHDTILKSKRRRSLTKSSEPDADADYTDHRDPGAETDSSEDDDVDIVTTSANKRQRREPREVTTASSSKTLAGPSQKKSGTKSKKYNAQDVRAARWLLSLSMSDRDLSMGPNGPVNLGDTARGTTMRAIRSEDDEDGEDEDSESSEDGTGV